jgi:quercetin dioxygenase-like cupin family protein
MNGTIHGPGEGIRKVDLAGSTMVPKEDGSTSGGAFVVAESTFAPGMFEMPLHLHREMAESLYLLSGRLDLQVGEERRTAAAGTFVSIPPGVAHTMSVVGNEPVRMLMILSNPARATQMLEIMEQVFANGEPDLATAGPLLAELDMEMVAPAAS